MLKSKSKLRFSCFFLFTITCLIFVQACASIDYKNKHDTKAFNLAKNISSVNKDIATSKGIGWLTIQDPEMEPAMATDFKIAWAAEPPDKIRITLISSGFPVETIVSNGKKITLFSHTGKHPLKTYNIKNPSLEDILAIPVRVEDIILLLSGQIPIKDFKYAFFENQTDNDSVKTIILKNKSDQGIQKISINSANQIKEYIITDWKIKPVYKVIFYDFIKINSAIIPSKMLIQDSLNREVSLKITKFYKNPPVKKTLFSLTEQR